MSTERYDAFVSAVTSECGKARDAVATDLRRYGLRVAVQSDLRHDPAEVSLLQALHDTIQDCDEMHCLIGRRSGDVPSAESAAPFSDFLPDDMPEASYTQWEYFFARHYLPDQTWLYRTDESYQPDDASPSGEDRPDLQQRFLDHLRRRNDRYVRFATVDGARAEVALVRRGPGHPGEAHGGGHAAHEPLSRGIAANAIGSVIAGALLSALPLLFAQLGSGPALVLLLLVPALLLGAGGFVAFFVMYRRYETILTWRGADARTAYADLRQSLTEGGLAARIYADRLRRALAAVDRFFGDAGMADRALFPHAFGLKERWPLWTAASFDRSLLLALLYPVATILIIWALSGHVGPAEHALELQPDLPGWRRTGALAGLGLACLGTWRGMRTIGWGKTYGIWFAAGCVGAGAFGTVGNVGIAAAVAIAVATAALARISHTGE